MLKNRIIVPVNGPLLIGNVKKNILDCLKKNFISSSGAYVKEFEQKFAKFLKKKYAISVSNGTAALQLAIESLNLKKGSEVILPSFTIISCILPLIRCGLKPVLIDSDLSSWNMKVEDIEKKINKKTKAIMVVHIYGMPTDMKVILKLAKKYKLKIIEDSAESIGLTFDNKQCGSFGDVSTFSFFANKHITTGEGGMIVTNSLKIANRCRSLRNLFFNNERRFKHYELGWNYRLTNLQAAIGVAQLEKINYFIKKKRKMGDYYQKHLNTLSKYVYLPKIKNKYSKNVYWVFGLVLRKDAKISLKKVMEQLKRRGIETRNFFWPLHQQPILKKMGYFKNSKHPNAEFLSKNGFYIPSGLSISQKDQKYVIKNLINILEKKNYV